MDAYGIPTQIGCATGIWMWLGSLQWNPSFACPGGCNKRQNYKAHGQSNQYLFSIHEITPYLLMFPEKLSLHWIECEKPHQIIDGDAP
jgi:hypothetical protein